VIRWGVWVATRESKRKKKHWGALACSYVCTAAQFIWITVDALHYIAQSRVQPMESKLHHRKTKEILY